MHRTRVKRIFLRKFLRIYMRFSLVVLGVFGVVAFFHPGFFVYGARSLSQVLADDSLTVTALVLPAPATPVVTSDLTCNPLNLSMAIKLDWQQDTGGGTFSYDILRNGLPLVSGLTNNTQTYTDTALTIATPYVYTIRAIGPMGPGFVDSLPLSITTPYNCNGLSSPTVEVTKFRGKIISTFKDVIPFSYDRTPVVTGTSNIPFAIIRVSIHSETRLVSYTVANANGYWEWKSPDRLEFERSKFAIRATDPLNSNRYAETSLRYQIKRSESDETGEKKSDAQNEGGILTNSDGGEATPPVEPTEDGFSFDLSEELPEIKQGEVNKLTFTPRGLSKDNKEQNIPVEFQLLDSDSNPLTTLTRDIFFREGESFHTDMTIPLYIRPGEYKLRAQFVYNDVHYSKEIRLIVHPLTVVTLTNGKEITYDEVMWNLGWVSLLSFGTVSIWLFFMFHEYWLYLRGTGHVTEFKIAKQGYFSRL